MGFRGCPERSLLRNRESLGIATRSSRKNRPELLSVSNSAHKKGQKSVHEVPLLAFGYSCGALVLNTRIARMDRPVGQLQIPQLLGFKSSVEVLHGDVKRSNFQNCTIFVENGTRKEFLGIVGAPPSPLHSRVQFLCRKPLEALLEQQNADAGRFRFIFSEQALQHAYMIPKAARLAINPITLIDPLGCGEQDPPPKKKRPRLDFSRGTQV